MCVARVAQTRFHVPTAMVEAAKRAGDPVVTSEAGLLRFESLSQCCGAHIRYDLHGLRTYAQADGTTNVEFTEPTVEALRGVTRTDPLRITVAADEVSFRSRGREVVEERAPLPQRWVQGFGEVPFAVSPSATPLLSLDGPTARDFLRGLPGGRSGRLTYWAHRAGPRVRLSPRPVPDGAPVSGPIRLKVLEPLARHADGLTAYGRRDHANPRAVTWALRMPGGVIHLSLSPDWHRGFTGEGALLLDLAAPSADGDARTIVNQLNEIASFSDEDVERLTGLSVRRRRAGLAMLSVHGELGYDVSRSVYFWRLLPFPQELRAADPPRLRDARALTRSGGVELLSETAALVHSGSHEHSVSLDEEHYSCTCPWVARHGTSRGPCKHVLAALIARGSDVE